MSFTDYENHDGLGLAQLVQQGEVTPLELLEAALARIALHNPALNAVVTPLYDAARAEIARGLPAGPFQGVPFLVKELVASVAGAAAGGIGALGALSVAGTCRPLPMSVTTPRITTRASAASRPESDED